MAPAGHSSGRCKSNKKTGKQRELLPGRIFSPTSYKLFSMAVAYESPVFMLTAHIYLFIFMAALLILAHEQWYCRRPELYTVD
jgi:hypothetical protein